MATVQRIDVSASYHGPSAVPATSEDRLFYAHRNIETGVETRVCVCGGRVFANPAAPGRGVQAHNFTGRHRAWRKNREEIAE